MDLDPDDGQWHWIKLSGTIAVTTPGVYVLTIFRGERETEIDKVMMTTGQAESARLQ